MTLPFVGYEYLDRWTRRRTAERLMREWEAAGFDCVRFIHEELVMRNDELEIMMRDMAADGKFCDPSDLRAVLRATDVFDGYRRANCRECKRTLIYSTPTFNAVHANGLTDGPTLCSTCKGKRNARLTAGGDR